jgi:hypothetical protein
VENNYIGGGIDENNFDVKNPFDNSGNMIYLRNNYIDGSRIGSGHCTLFHGRTDTNAGKNIFYTVDIAQNYFKGCKGAINWRSVGPDGPSGNVSDGSVDIGHLEVRANIFDMSGGGTAVNIMRSNISLIDNTVRGGKLMEIKPGYKLPQPQDVVVRNGGQGLSCFSGANLPGASPK